MATIARRNRGVALWVLAVIGYVVAGLSLLDGFMRDGGAAYDFSSYFGAAQRYAASQPLYAAVEINDPGAYRYLPTFAAALVPITILPELVATWLYRAGCVLALRYLVGSWRAVGISLLFPPVLIELWALNVTLPFAAATRWALRGKGVGLVAATAFVKYGTAVMAPYLWARRPDARSSLVVGLALTTALVAVHVAVDPAAWLAFGESLLQQGGSTNDAPYIGDQLLFLLPSTTGDFALRLLLAAIITFVAVCRGSDALAFVAVTIAVPTLWLARLAPLVALPRLWAEDRHRYAVLAGAPGGDPAATPIDSVSALAQPPVMHREC